MKTRTGVIILVLGFLCLTATAVSVVLGVMGFMDRLKPVTVAETPGASEFRIAEPGIYTLWHDHTTTVSGTTHHHPRDLPPGFSFTLTNLDNGNPAAFRAIASSTTQTMNTPERESVGLGTFQVPDPGSYKLEVSNPAGDQRFVSLTEGAFLASFGSFAASLGIAALLGLLGIGGLIAGFIGVLTARRTPPAASPPPPIP